MTAHDDADEYITLDAAMQRLRRSRRQVYRLAAEGKIATQQTRRGQLYRRIDVEQIAQDLRVDDEPEPAPIAPSQLARRDPEVAAEIRALRSLRTELEEAAVAVREQRMSREDREAMERHAAEQAQRLDRAIAALEAQSARGTEASRWRPLIIVAVVLAVALIVGLVVALVLALAR